MPDKKKVAITGANGFLGRNTIISAIKDDWTVFGIIRNRDAADTIKVLGANPIIIKDFQDNKLYQVFEQCDAVIHVAGIAVGSEQELENVNVKGTETVVKIAALTHVTRFITVSGLGIHLYGKANWATNNYFRSKIRLEEVVRNADISSIIFRPSYILGPGDELIPNFVRQLLDGIISIVGPGTAPMQPIYVKDAAQVFLSAASGKGKDTVIYDLVGPEITNMLQLLTMVKDILTQYQHSLPETQIKYISSENAEEKIGLPKELVDIMLSNALGDPEIISKEFGIHLSPLKDAIDAAIRAEVQL